MRRCCVWSALLLSVPALVWLAHALPGAPGSGGVIVVAGEFNHVADVFGVSGSLLDKAAVAFDSGDRIAVGDVDGDGIEELLVANDSGGAVNIYDPAGVPRGSFAAGFDLGDGFAVGNVGGSAAEEILVAGSVGGRVHIFDATGAEPYPDFGAGFDAGDGFDVADVDGDDIDEILVVGDVGHHVHIFDGSGAEPYPDFASGYDPGDGFAAGDVDGDGTDEILVAGDVGGHVHIFDADGDEIYPDFDAGYDLGDRLTTGDVDGDGTDEILVAGDVSGQVNIFDRDGDRPYPAFDGGYDLGDGFAAGRASYPDADGDGLLDSWEELGLDVDFDGTIDVDLPGLGADPMHKDLFLEIDRRLGLDPIPAEFLTSLLVSAPVDAGGVPNPDGLPGISLHVDQTPPGGGEVDIPDFCYLGDEFYAAKAANFDPARKWVYRYALAVDGAPGGVFCDKRGQGELGGNDLILHVEPSATTSGTTLPEVLAHEFGHTLGLMHGGDENHDCKPNYPSVMNKYHGTPNEYSPPRTTMGRGLPVLPTLREDALDESQVLDPTDDTNFLRFVDGAGQLVTSPLNEPVDWNGNGVIDPVSVAVNIDTSPALAPTSLCTNDSVDGVLTGHDDWSNISLGFRQDGDAQNLSVDPVDPDAEPSLEEELFIEAQVNTTDLALDKADDADPVIPGGQLRYTLTITNRGPNPARDVRLVDTLPAEVKYVSDDAGCVEEPVRTLTCSLGPLRARHVRVVEITALVSGDLVINPDEPLLILNKSEVENLAGPDPQPANDSDAEQTTVVAPTDGDGDGIPDPFDRCPYYASNNQRDTDADRRGDVCECGDQTGDGRNTVSDLISINEAIFKPTLETPLCDANNDDRCNVRDIIAANLEIYSPGNTSTCARQPFPGP
jgi:uncharacterized repeat protein (TIGR01451 family)